MPFLANPDFIGITTQSNPNLHKICVLRNKSFQCFFKDVEKLKTDIGLQQMLQKMMKPHN